MNLLALLIGLVLTSLVAGFCLVAILVYFNPISSNWLIFSLFYISIFISSASFLALIGWLIRRISRIKKFPLPKNQAIQQLEVSFRQGILLSLLLVSILILQSQRMLFWWDLLLLVGLIVFIEWQLNKR